MDLVQAIEYALDGDALLFVGAGFSSGATNLVGMPLRSAQSLTEHLLRELDLDEITNLEDAAEEYLEVFGEDALIELLHNEFTASKIKPYHLAFADIPWRRVYTTNYDNVIEHSYAGAGRRLNPVTPSDKVWKMPDDGTLCVHLNGYIDVLNRETLGGEFKLTHSSYSSGRVADSEWVALLRQDLKIARAVFFLGYSMADLDIRRILFDTEDLKAKTFFVLRSGTEKSSGRRAELYGTIVQSSVEEFAETIATKKANYSPKRPISRIGYAVKQWAPPDVISRVSDRDLFDLFLLGEFKSEYIWRDSSEASPYIVWRSATDQVVNLIKNNQVVTIYSEIGNGKSLLVKEVATRAYQDGYAVFFVERLTEGDLAEIDSVLQSDHKEILVVIDDYVTSLHVLEFIQASWRNGVRVLLSSRASIHDAYSDRVSGIFQGKSVAEISVDRLSPSDLSALSLVFEEYGLWRDLAASSTQSKERFLTVSGRGQFASILVQLLRSPQIFERFGLILDDVRGRRNHYQALITMFVLSVLQFPTTLDTLADIWGEEVLSSKFRNDPAIRQLCSFSEGKVRLRSAVVSRFLLQSMSDAPTIIEVLTVLIRSAERLQNVSPNYRQILLQLMRFSSVNQVLPEAERKSSIVTYYEEIKNLNACIRNPQFWLQYAIASLVLEDLERSEAYFQSAYSFAEAIPNYPTYQIDNHYARFMLEKAISHPNSDYMVVFRKAREIVFEQMQHRDRFDYPYRVATTFGKFVEVFRDRMNSKELEEVARSAAAVLLRINALGHERQGAVEILRCRKAMNDILELAAAADVKAIGVERP